MTVVTSRSGHICMLCGVRCYLKYTDTTVLSGNNITKEQGAAVPTASKMTTKDTTLLYSAQYSVAHCMIMTRSLSDRKTKPIVKLEKHTATWS